LAISRAKFARQVNSGGNLLGRGLGTHPRPRFLFAALLCSRCGVRGTDLALRPDVRHRTFAVPPTAGRSPQRPLCPSPATQLPRTASKERPSRALFCVSGYGGIATSAARKCPYFCMAYRNACRRASCFALGALAQPRQPIPLRFRNHRAATLAAVGACTRLPTGPVPWGGRAAGNRTLHGAPYSPLAADRTRGNGTGTPFPQVSRNSLTVARPHRRCRAKLPPIDDPRRSNRRAHAELQPHTHHDG
jgi:hypothetical protein